MNDDKSLDEMIDDFIYNRDGSKKGVQDTPKTLGKPSGNLECIGDEWYLTMGETYAYRSWNRDSYGRLNSPQQKFVWRPGKNTAFDRKVYEGRKATPHGFFAYTDEPTWDGEIKGVIKAWGWVTEGTRGITAEHAEIVALYDPEAPKDAEKPDDKRELWLARRYATRVYNGKRFSPKPSSIAGIVFAGAASSVIAAITTAVMGMVTLAIVLGGVFAAAVAGLVWLVHTDSIVDELGKPVKDKPKVRSRKYTLAELYPDAKIYNSEKKMLKDYKHLIESVKPPPPPPPTPDDEEFWTQ